MIGAAAVLAFLLAPPPASPALPPLEPVPPGELRVTQGEGRPEAGGLRVDGPRLRAEAPGRSGHRAELRFTYLGPSAAAVPLASGAPRRQVGVKLRARDGCNLLYAMWRLAPDARVVVQLKHNPGQHTSRACGNRGYRTLRPERARAVRPPEPGETGVLRADVEGGRLAVRVGGLVVWEGALPPEAGALEGPPGLRTDNTRALVALAAAR